MAVSDYRGKGGTAKKSSKEATFGNVSWSDLFTPRGGTAPAPTYTPGTPVYRGRGGVAEVGPSGFKAPSTISPAIMPQTSPLTSITSADERARAAARGRATPQKRAAQAQRAGGTGGGGTGGGGSSVGSLFAPLFQALDQQRAQAESRYAENAGQIQNIYGQLIGARKADITDIEEAYKRLQTAAATRGAATTAAMSGREATRLSQNEAVLESMGVGDIGTTAGDVAAQSATVAQDVELMNQSNWAGMLSAMGATSQEIARADVTSYGYRQGEDIAKLQAAKEQYLGDIAGQEFELKFQEQQARLQAQQAAAANAARVRAAEIEAASRAEREQYERTQNYLKGTDALTSALGNAALNGLINETQGIKIRQAYADYANRSKALSNPMSNRASALAEFEQLMGGSNLTDVEKSVLRTVVSNTFNK